MNWPRRLLALSLKNRATSKKIQRVLLVVRFATQSLSTGALDRMLDLAKSLLAVEDARLDADPWLLNVENGTIDLRTGLREKHDPRDLLTKMAPVRADRGAKCPLFKKFLKRITGDDADFRVFIQKAVGYSLTGITTEQVLFFVHGKSGNNGKSTLVNLIRDMLGDYGLHTPTETLLVKQYDNAIPADLARLDGARMVTAIEANFNRHLDEARIKSMTGGEPITARFMRQDFFQFAPVLKLWLVANDRPRVRGTDKAFWRRVRVIPLTIEIPEAARAIRQLELSLCALHTLEQDRRVGRGIRNSGEFWAARRQGACHRFHDRPGAPACSRRKRGNQNREALGRSRGGFSTKIHLRTNAKGRPADLRRDRRRSARGQRL